jgi:hypothetical protein
MLNVCHLRVAPVKDGAAAGAVLNFPGQDGALVRSKSQHMVEQQRDECTNADIKNDVEFL